MRGMSYFGTVDIFIHIRILELLDMLANGVIAGKYCTIDRNELIGDNRVLGWNPVSVPLIRERVNPNPIIIIPFPIDRYSYVVIDGNHRVNYFLTTDESCIKATKLSPQTIAENGLFLSDFDKAVYALLVEVQALARLQSRQYLTAESNMELIQRTFPYTGHILTKWDVFPR